MGTAFTIDTPIKVARFGINSVISIVDDMLIEDVREHYARESGEEFEPIPKYSEDARARRITSYLDLVSRIIKRQMDEMQISAFKVGSDIVKFFDLLHDSSSIKELYREMLGTEDVQEKKQLQDKLRTFIKAGDIDVNIMTKVDCAMLNKKGDSLGPEYTASLGALRGFANSELSSSVVFSAGMNPRLYAYLENFPDFYPDSNGFVKKKITLKVSDFRSASIQGRYLAKRGLWISEFRIESGLDCGGHAFATEGLLMGPILEEFKTKKQELTAEVHEIYSKALIAKGFSSPAEPRHVKLTAQGGIGTAKENKFLLDYYGLDSTGWGTPFLLVPEVTVVDDETMKKMAMSGKEAFQMSHTSPLGITFNYFRYSSGEKEKRDRIKKGNPGSPCPKKYLVSNSEFTEKPICTASRQYQKLKIAELQEKKLTPEIYSRKYEEIVDKSCLCVGLATTAYIKFSLRTKSKQTVLICPGPNMAYFSKISTLAEMIDHIYGRIESLANPDRPNMFINELSLYVEYLRKEVEHSIENFSAKQSKYLRGFKENLAAGVEYYRNLFPIMQHEAEEASAKMYEQLEKLEQELIDLCLPEFQSNS